MSATGMSGMELLDSWHLGDSLVSKPLTGLAGGCLGCVWCSLQVVCVCV